MPTLVYELLPIESGVFAELYLPKRAHYQGLLFDTLTAGFDVNKVRQHFRKKRDLIEAYVKTSAMYWEIPGITPGSDRLLSNGLIDRFPDLLRGYTMYEVNGVFRSDNTGKVIEEHTQVIRLMFRPDFTARLGLK